MGERDTYEEQYKAVLEFRDRKGSVELGLASGYTWDADPRRLLFALSRYKFVAKMLEGRERVLEVGCGDAFASRIVQQSVGRLTATDVDSHFVEDIEARQDPDWPLDARVHNMLDGPLDEGFDAAYALDVYEHIPPEQEDRFVDNVVRSLGTHGELILGIPSLQSQRHASAISKAGHVNCKDAPEFRAHLARWLHHVFVFSMNDEVVHTGFHPMAHYLLALCCGRRS